MTIEEVLQIHKDTVEAIEFLRKEGFQIPPEALTIQALAEFALAKYEKVEILEEDIRDMRMQQTVRATEY